MTYLTEGAINKQEHFLML